MNIKIGIIGGSEFYDLLTNAKEKTVKTPFGKPSEKISIGEINWQKVAFIPRHGKNHRIPPHKINHWANIYALKYLGVENIISVASTGIINKKIKIGHFVILDDFIDFTKQHYTFYDHFKNEPIHVDITYPFSPRLRQIIINVCKERHYPFYNKGTYVNTAGPRLETPAEIRMFKNLGADVVGMTVAPEATLSKEMNIEYATIAVGVNYACGIGKSYVVLDDRVMSEKKIQLKELIKGVIAKMYFVTSEIESS